MSPLDQPGRDAATARLPTHDHAAPSVFTPEHLLRRARMQKGLPDAAAPEICLLDPDGDIVRRLRADGRATPHPGWACYHTALDTFRLGAETVGVVGCAVGASFAVLVAEQLFASGCRLLLSVTSAGAIGERRPGSWFVLIDRALRDEGTSAHYLPADIPAAADPALLAVARPALAATSVQVRQGAVWTTDAPYRETARAIADAEALGVLAVEMEAAGLYAFAAARAKPVLCLAHVTNAMAQGDGDGDGAGDFEKGEADGTVEALIAVRAIAEAWRAARTQAPWNSG